MSSLPLPEQSSIRERLSGLTTRIGLLRRRFAFVLAVLAALSGFLTYAVMVGDVAMIAPKPTNVVILLSVNLFFLLSLAVVIGRICRDVPPEQATDVIHGYTIGNDVTARDLQRSDVQFTRAKGFDSFCPLGPWIETDLDPQAFADGVRIQTHLNGDLRQDASTADLIFDIPTLVAHVSSVMTLLPGDVILTGTPAGVGPMEVGDEVEVSIAGIGTLTNKVARR